MVRTTKISTVRPLLLLLLFIAIAVYSCSSPNSNNLQEDPYLLKMDSTSQANVKTKEAELAAKNDSTINALSVKRADSIENATKDEEHANKNFQNSTPKNKRFLPDTVK